MNFLFEFLKLKYEQKFDKMPKEFETDLFFLESVKELITDLKENELKSIIDDERLTKKIQERDEQYILYSHPIVFLIYYLLKFKKWEFVKLFPFPPNDLEPFLVDLGISQRILE